MGFGSNIEQGHHKSGFIFLRHGGMILPTFYVSRLCFFGQLTEEAHRQRRRGTFELLEMIHIPIPIFMSPSDFRHDDRHTGSDHRYQSQEETNREMKSATSHGLSALLFERWTVAFRRFIHEIGGVSSNGTENWKQVRLQQSAIRTFAFPGQESPYNRAYQAEEDDS